MASMRPSVSPAQSRNTSRVCSPNTGAPTGSRTGVPDKRNEGIIVFSSPKRRVRRHGDQIGGLGHGRIQRVMDGTNLACGNAMSIHALQPFRVRSGCKDGIQFLGQRPIC